MRKNATLQKLITLMLLVVIVMGVYSIASAQDYSDKQTDTITNVLADATTFTGAVSQGGFTFTVDPNSKSHLVWDNGAGSTGGQTFGSDIVLIGKNDAGSSVFVLTHGGLFTYSSTATGVTLLNSGLPNGNYMPKGTIAYGLMSTESNCIVIFANGTVSEMDVEVGGTYGFTLSPKSCGALPVTARAAYVKYVAVQQNIALDGASFADLATPEATTTAALGAIVCGQDIAATDLTGGNQFVLSDKSVVYCFTKSDLKFAVQYVTEQNVWSITQLDVDGVPTTTMWTTSQAGIANSPVNFSSAGTGENAVFAIFIPAAG